MHSGRRALSSSSGQLPESQRPVLDNLAWHIIRSSYFRTNAAVEEGRSVFSIWMVLMLVLSRRQNETLIIGDNIVITVLSISANQVRLGIEAPREMRVLRGNIKTQHEATGARHDRPVSAREVQHRFRKK